MYEYKAVPAPVRAPRVKGLKSSAERFAHMLSAAINAEAHGGWQFLRSETLACEERSALGRVRTSTQTVLIFARALTPAASLDEAEYGYDMPAEPQRAQEPQWMDAQDEVHYDEAQAAQDDAYAPAPEAQPDYAPEPAAPARPAAQRQEPLFRSSALLRGGEARMEPVLRPWPDETERDRS